MALRYKVTKIVLLAEAGTTPFQCVGVCTHRMSRHDCIWGTHYVTESDAFFKRSNYEYYSQHKRKIYTVRNMTRVKSSWTVADAATAAKQRFGDWTECFLSSAERTEPVRKCQRSRHFTSITIWHLIKNTGRPAPGLDHQVSPIQIVKTFWWRQTLSVGT